MITKKRKKKTIKINEVNKEINVVKKEQALHSHKFYTGHIFRPIARFQIVSFVQTSWIICKRPLNLL